MKSKTILLTTFIPLFLLAGAKANTQPYQKEGRSWISLHGKIKVVTPHTFLLDYDADGYKLLQGDNVMAFGRIDDDTFETTTIEASSVWVDSINTYFYANSADERDIPSEVSVSGIHSELQVTGTISDIEGREFTLNTGASRLRIDTARLDDNPLDDKGHQRLEIGDRVTVDGKINNNWRENREIMADFILTPEDQSKS